MFLLWFLSVITQLLGKYLTSKMQSLPVVERVARLMPATKLLIQPFKVKNLSSEKKT